MPEDKSGSYDSFMGWGLILGCVIILLMILWHFQKEIFKNIMLHYRYGQMWLADWFTDDDKPGFVNGDVMRFEDTKAMSESILNGDIYNYAPNFFMSAAMLGDITMVALDPYRWIMVAILVIMTIHLYYKGPESEFRNKFSLETLIKHQAKVFPVIAPFIDFNPAKLPPRPPGSPVPAEIQLFAEALGPEEWIAYNAIPIIDGNLDEKIAAKAFAKQLGPRWAGPQNLAPYKQIILAACCLKAVRKRAEADHMLGRLALCWSKEKGLQLSKDRKLIGDARKILRDKKLAGATLNECRQHGWQTTALLRALFYARSEGGVMAPAQFVWLRGFDRALWYPLNNLGRNSYHMEAIGAISHFKAEKRVSRPIPKPKVENAVKAIVEYMNSDNARPVPQVDYSMSNKRGVKKMKKA